MRVDFVLRGGAVPRSCFLSAALGLAVVAAAPGRAQTLPQVPAPGVEVLYTGRLFGYFRLPDWPTAGDATPCAAVGWSEASPAAQAFEAQRSALPGAILVATGDDFAPELEARQFRPDAAVPSGLHGKDLFDWFPAGLQDGHAPQGAEAGRWLDYGSVARLGMRQFNDFLAQGWGFVRHDNVGCFLVRERFDAIVPGRQDLYFGPERLRMLARYLASTRTGDGHATAMLGANLVMATRRIRAAAPAPGAPPPWVASLVQPKPRATVYPWLAGAKFALASVSAGGALARALQTAKSQGRLQTLDAIALALDSKACASEAATCTRLRQVAAQLEHARLYLCAADSHGQMPANGAACGAPLPAAEVQLDGSAVEAAYWFSDQANFDLPLAAGGVYGLCGDGPALSATGSGEKPLPFACQPFSVFTPFFAYHSPQPPAWHAPAPAADWQVMPGEPFTEPPPFVVVPADAAAGRSADTAIFGVLDPDIAGYVGALNLDWVNSNSEFVTSAEILDPAEALREQIEFFEQRYRRIHGRAFQGVRILLAQMEPQVAETLAARMKALGFSMVVTAADDDFATTGRTAEAQVQLRGGDDPPPAQVVIPSKYYDARRVPAESEVEVGSIRFQGGAGGWRVTAAPMGSTGMPAHPPAPLPAALRQRLTAALAACGAPATAPGAAQASDGGRLTYLTLCAMQRAENADVALLQRRDLFTDLPPEIGGEDAQQILDRVLWKGDFLTLMYVPGSALVSVLHASDAFGDEVGAALSLTDEHQRDLITLGITRDGGGYRIDNQPLDPTRLYAVATTDYIGAGDTGYPDFQRSAVNRKLLPRDFPSSLQTVSSVACRMLYPAGASPCQPVVELAQYMDASAMEPSRPATPADPPAATARAAAPALADLVEAHTQQRPLLAEHINQPSPSLLAVDSASLGLSTLNHRFSDAELKTLFPNSPVTQLGASDSHSTLFDIRTSSGVSFNRADLFENLEAAYNATYQGQTSTVKGQILQASRSVSQRTNLFSSDTGVSVPLWADRMPPHFASVSSFHYETQLFNPLPNIRQSLSLATSSPSYATLTSRAQLLLPREGLKLVGANNWFEAGVEAGEQIHAVRGAVGSAVPLVRPNIAVSGSYWDWHWNQPLTRVVNLTVDDDSDLFFNRHGDAASDTRFRADTKAAFNFRVMPSISFAPTYELFLYENKVQNVWFWQGQASIQVKFRFDLWNAHSPGSELRYSPGR